MNNGIIEPTHRRSSYGMIHEETIVVDMCPPLNENDPPLHIWGFTAKSSFPFCILITVICPKKPSAKALGFFCQIHGLERAARIRRPP